MIQCVLMAPRDYICVRNPCISIIYLYPYLSISNTPTYINLAFESYKSPSSQEFTTNSKRIQMHKFPTLPDSMESSLTWRMRPAGRSRRHVSDNDHNPSILLLRCVLAALRRLLHAQQLTPNASPRGAGHSPRRGHAARAVVGRVIRRSP